MFPESNADAFVEDSDGRTVVHKCAERDRLDCATCILDHQQRRLANETTADQQLKTKKDLRGNSPLNLTKTKNGPYLMCLRDSGF